MYDFNISGRLKGEYRSTTLHQAGLLTINEGENSKYPSSFTIRDCQSHSLATYAACNSNRIIVRLLAFTHGPSVFLDVRSRNRKPAAPVEHYSAVYRAMGTIIFDSRALGCNLQSDMFAAPVSRGQLLKSTHLACSTLSQRAGESGHENRNDYDALQNTVHAVFQLVFPPSSRKGPVSE
jgi:hypothetical protein